MPLLDTKSDIREIATCILPCAGCGGVSELHIYRVIARPRLGVAPVGRRRIRYMAVCSGCGGIYGFQPEKGKALACKQSVSVFRRDIFPLDAKGKEKGR